MNQTPTPENSSPLPTAQLLAGFAIPGLGHVLQKRYKRAAIFAIVIYGMFVAGMCISNMTAIDPDHHPVYWWLTQFANGAPAWIVRWGGLMAPPEIGNNVSINEQMVGLTYVCIAGLSNLLSLLELVKHNPAFTPAEASSEKGEGK